MVQAMPAPVRWRSGASSVMVKAALFLAAAATTSCGVTAVIGERHGVGDLDYADGGEAGSVLVADYAGAGGLVRTELLCRSPGSGALVRCDSLPPKDRPRPTPDHHRLARRGDGVEDIDFGNGGQIGHCRGLRGDMCRPRTAIFVRLLFSDTPAQGCDEDCLRNNVWTKRTWARCATEGKRRKAPLPPPHTSPLSLSLSLWSGRGRGRPAAALRANPGTSNRCSHRTPPTPPPWPSC